MNVSDRYESWTVVKVYLFYFNNDCICSYCKYEDHFMKNCPFLQDQYSIGCINMKYSKCMQQHLDTVNYLKNKWSIPCFTFNCILEVRRMLRQAKSPCTNPWDARASIPEATCWPKANFCVTFKAGTRPPGLLPLSDLVANKNCFRSPCRQHNNFHLISNINIKSFL